MNSPRYLRVKVKPNSKQSMILEELDDEHQTLKISLKAAPHKGQANKALIQLLSKEFNLDQSKIKIISGQTSSIKLIRLDS